MRDVVIIGELNVDFVLHNFDTFPSPGREVLVESFRMALGSASAICAMGLARLGAPVSFVGRVGDDPWGAYCVDTLASAGIDVAAVVRDPQITTGVTVSISSPTERALVTYPGSIAEQTLAHLDAFPFAGARRHLHVSSYYLQSGLRPGCAELFRRASAAGWTTSLDPGCDPTNSWGTDLLATLAEVDVFLPNEVELRGISGVEDPAVDARDTTGAGDSFNAGFLYAWLDRRPLRACLQAGNICGALSTRGIGGTATQAVREELESCLASVS